MDNPLYVLKMYNVGLKQLLRAQSPKPAVADCCAAFSPGWRLGLEPMPFGWALAGQAMTSSWGEGVLGLGRAIPHPHTIPPILFYFWKKILTNNCCPPRLIPPTKKSTLHPCRPLVQKSHIECTLHLEGPKFNIYVHFPLLSKQLTMISFSKWNQKHVHECQ